jgi:diaminopimelate decarboxylase
MPLLLGTQRINQLGHLEIGGCDTVELADRFGTPLYVVDEQTIREKCRAYRSAFDKRYPDNVICFAGKSFLTMAMVRIVEQEGLHLDVASGGELHLALAAGFPPHRINMHGNNKSLQEIAYAVRAGVGHIVLDHFDEIEQVAAEADMQNRTVAVLVRCAPGVDPHTHKAISTGQADTKFGFNIQDGSAVKAVELVLQKPSLAFDGIHCHIGSQLLDTDAHLAAVDAMVALMAEIRDRLRVLCRVVNIGGGLGVRYRTQHQPPEVDDYAEQVVSRLCEQLQKHDLPQPTLQQEPGRSIVGEAGITLYRVGVVKTVPITEEPGTRTYVAVDGGLSDNPRPQLYDAVYEIVAANRASEPHDRVVTISGKHCETDVLLKDGLAPDLKPGDLLAFQTTGAYNHVMASNYNFFTRPAVVLVNNGNAEVIVHRESLDDLLRREHLPARFVKAG